MRGGSITNSSTFRRRRGISGRIVFTAPIGTPFTVPSTGTNNQQVNGGVTITTTGGTGPFSGATGWSNNAGGNPFQPFRFDIPVSSPPGSTRSLNYRFNSFTLVGSCATCGLLITPASQQTIPNPFPLSGIGIVGDIYNAKILAGSLYGQQTNTFALPNSPSTIGSISFEANSNNLYTITIDSPAPKQSDRNNNIRDSAGL